MESFLFSLVWDICKAKPQLGESNEVILKFVSEFVFWSEITQPQWIAKKAIIIFTFAFNIKRMTFMAKNVLSFYSLSLSFFKIEWE